MLATQKITRISSDIWEIGACEDSVYQTILPPGTHGYEAKFGRTISFISLTLVLFLEARIMRGESLIGVANTILQAQSSIHTVQRLRPAPCAHALCTHGWYGLIAPLPS